MDDDDDVPPQGEGRLIGDEDYQKGFNEKIDDTLNLDTWEKVWETEVERILTSLGEEISDAEKKQSVIRQTVRNKILPLLKTGSGVAGTGVFKANAVKMRNAFEGLLFPGHVGALSSTVSSYDGMSLGITQIGMVAMSYGGYSGNFSQQLYRKSLTTQNHDEIKEVLESLKRLHHASGQRDNLSDLARRGIRAYAERAILIDKVKTEWRVGLGNPCSRDILSGLKYPRLLNRSLAMLRRLIDYKKFAFVATSLDERAYLAIGDALNPGEYAIINTLEQDSRHFIKQWEYNDEVRQVALDFVEDCCPNVFMGLFRVSEHAPPRLFYAHKELVHVAAHIVMADSLLRPERGFPLLLDVADTACRSVFGSESFLGLVHDAYARVGAKFHYFGER